MHLPFRLNDSETECPSDHRRRATEIVPVHSSGLERGARRGERGSWETPNSPLTRTFAEAGSTCYL